MERLRSRVKATIEDMEHYSKPPMTRNQESVILHVGTNSLATNKPAEEIAVEITNLAIHLQNRENKITISAIISWGDDSALNMKAKAVNEYLKIMYNAKDLDLIEHQNIDVVKHLNGRALHLNRMGKVSLANNITNISKCNDMMMGLDIISTQIRIVCIM